jgi:hypothetical protein
MTTIQQTVNQIKKDLALMNQYYDRETMDMLLTRDWFVDDDTIEDVLNCADEDAWNWIYENRAKYSTRIRMWIEPEDYQFPVEKLKIRVVELTDKMIAQMESEKKKKTEEAFEKDWVEYAKTLENRPVHPIDSQLDHAWEKITFAKAALQKYLEKPAARKYVAPSARGTVPADTKETELNAAIQKAENEYEKLQEEEKQVDTLYWTDKRDDYRKIWMPNM